MEASNFGTEKKHPSWGSKKLFVRLRRMFCAEGIPSRATISRILKQAGLVTAQRRTRQKVGPERPDPTRLAPVWCNDVWGVDFKGWFYTGDGYKCYPLTISDLYSRYIICCDDLASMALPGVWKSFERTFEGVWAASSDTGRQRQTIWGWLGVGIDSVERVVASPRYPSRLY